MVQKAVVTEVCGGNKAVVLVKRETACGKSCESCGAGCAGSDMISVTAKNAANAVMGDRVKVESSTKEVMLSAFLVYMVPFILFFLFYILGESVIPAHSMGLVAGACGFLLGILCAVLYGKRKKDGIAFTITEILPSE